MLRRCCCFATWRGRRGRAACCCSRPSGTPRPRCPEALADDAGGPAPRRRRRAAAARGLSDEEVSEFVQPRPPRAELGADLRELAGAISELTGGNPFLVCELWRALVETGDRSSSVDDERAADPSVRRARDAGERARGREPAARAAGAGDDAAARAGAPPRATSSSSSCCAEESGSAAGRELIARSTRPSAAGSSRSCPGAGSRTGSRTSWSGAPSTTASAGSGGPSFTCGSVRRGRRPSGGRRGRSPTSPTTSRRPRRSASASARSSTTSSPRGAATDALAFDEAARCLRTALELGIDDERRASRAAARAGRRQRTARARRSMRWTRSSAAAEIARTAERRRAAGPGGDRLRGRELAPGAIRDATVSCSRRPRPRSGTSDSELRVRLLSGLARALDMRG